jgi:hypothetical protein
MSEPTGACDNLLDLRLCVRSRYLALKCNLNIESSLKCRGKGLEQILNKVITILCAVRFETNENAIVRPAMKYEFWEQLTSVNGICQ